jgi:hypothetical protein
LPGISIPGQAGIYPLTWDGATGKIIAGTIIPPKSISTITRKKEYEVSTRVKIIYNKLNTIRNNAKVALRVKQLQLQRIDSLPETCISKYLGTRSNFVYFLRGLFNEPETGSTIQRLTGEYCLGCTDTGAVIYWQIDGQKRVRTGKVMRYNPQTGKRL